MSFLASPRRPRLRVETESGDIFQALPSPAFGRAIWFGPIPRDARSIWLQGGDGTAEGIEVESLDALSPAALPFQAPRVWRSVYALMLLASSGQTNANRQLRRALMSTPLTDYAAFREKRRRSPDWQGFDRPAQDVSRVPRLRILAPHRSNAEVEALLDERREPEWLRYDVAAAGVADSGGRVIPVPAGAALASALTGLAEHDVVLVADPQSRWETEAFVAIACAFLETSADVLYVDEVEEGAAPRPLLKPDWSPVLAQSQDLIGRGWAATAGWLRRRHGDARFDDVAELTLRPEPLDRVRHLARVLRIGNIRLRRRGAMAAPPTISGAAIVSVIVPTRDRVDLLRPCVESLTKAGCRHEAIVVDNGSADPAALAYLAGLEGRPGFRVLRRPGPFNFSALCNDAVRHAEGDTLLFLNNDVAALSEGWLAPLAAWAGEPTIGAVGAKLVYPNGRLQHGGVVIGIDGHANHFERFLPGDAPGFFERLALPHEVSAVTGACLAVEKRKFLAVGGFDEAHLPVEFNDIDLCLRLAERGWTSLIEPRSVLVHREGATRKISRDQERRYADQVRWFQSRWGDRLADDPYFHPLLSLDWHTSALG